MQEAVKKTESDFPWARSGKRLTFPAFPHEGSSSKRPRLHPLKHINNFNPLQKTHDLLLVDINRRLQYVIIVISEAVSVISRRPFTPVLFECKWGIQILYHYAHFETIQ